jgi:hypothetical protein
MEGNTTKSNKILEASFWSIAYLHGVDAGTVKWIPHSPYWCQHFYHKKQEYRLKRVFDPSINKSMKLNDVIVKISPMSL